MITIQNFIRKISLQIKTPRWTNGILIFIIILEILCIIYLNIDFFQKYSAAIQAFFTIILIFVTGYFAYQTYKFQRIQLLQPHSERIGKEISNFLNELNKAILDPRDLKETYQEHSQFLIIPQPSSLLLEHLKSGYSEIYKNYEKWSKSTKLYNRELINYVENSVIELDKWIEKEIKEDNLKLEIVYKYRIISYCFKKLLIPLFPDPIHKKTSLEELKETKMTELQWHGATILKGNPVLCIRLEKFIKNFIESRKEDIGKFWDNFESLRKKRREIIEEIKVKIVDTARYHGIIRGSCRACSEI